MDGRRIGQRLLAVAGGACLLMLGCPLGMATASASGIITVTALGSQGYGALFPTFSYSYGSLPGGVSLSGDLHCTTVNGGTPINSSLGTGSYTVDGSSCSGVSASDPSYTISYVGGTGGFSVGSPSAAPSFPIIEAGGTTVGGIPFVYSAGFTLSNTAGPESDPITVTVLGGSITPELTILSVPAPTDPHWNCSGSNLAAQTVTCVYTPTSSLPPGTSLSFGVNVVMAYDSSVTDDCSLPPVAPCDYYQTIIYTDTSSADASSNDTGGELYNLFVEPQSPAPTLEPNDYTTYMTAGTPTTFSIPTTSIYTASEPEPVTVTMTPDSSYPGVVFDDIPAQTDPNWDCSGSNLAIQVVSCTYTPPVGSPIPAGTGLYLTLDVSAPVRATSYVVGIDAGATSVDATSDPLQLSTIIEVDPPADATPPVISNLGATPSLTTLGNGTTVTATASDAEVNGTPVASASYSVNGGPWTPMAASDGSFDSTTENLTATVPAPASPVADTICVRATDAAGNTSDGTACTSFVVYDPSAGFVTGGGWITSPTGACRNPALCADAQGKATFGFVSKYLKGATVPTGNTQYVFHDGNFNFASSSYQWLVVNQSGTNAQFKGTGTINGQGSYPFMIWATSGTPNTFRIQVTDPATGNTIYDSGNQALGGGSIIIHTS